MAGKITRPPSGGGPSDKSVDWDKMLLDINNLKQSSEKARDEIKELRESLKGERITQFTVFGIFASLLVVLNIEFSLFKDIHSITKLIGVSLILLSSLLIFNIITFQIFSLFTTDEKPQQNETLYTIFTFVFIVGIIFTFWGSNDPKMDPEVFKEAKDSILHQVDSLNSILVVDHQRDSIRIDSAIFRIKKLQDTLKDIKIIQDTTDIYSSRGKLGWGFTFFYEHCTCQVGSGREESCKSFNPVNLDSDNIREHLFHREYRVQTPYAIIL